MNPERCIAFLQELIHTPSLPGQEGELAALVLAEMQQLGYDAAWQDDAGNVIGLIRGRGEAPAVMFNTHLDHVDPGDPRAWSHQPYGGAIAAGKVWGRGACDIKGPLAAQLYGVAALRVTDGPPPGDVYVTATVQEEVGGLGARFLLSHLGPTLVVVGEPSANTLRRGHRGRTELALHVKGRAAHASAPERAINPHFVVSNFVQRLPTLTMRQHAELGASSVAPTLLRTDQTSANVIPGEMWLTLDWRNVPGESGEDACTVLQPLVEASLIPGAKAEVEIPVVERRSFTGLTMRIPADNPAYSLPADHPAITAAAAILEQTFGQSVPIGHWRFATDGGHFAQAGMLVVGYGPGDESLAHTVREHIAIEGIEVALRGNAALARGLAMEYDQRRSG
ncbi:MAG: M20/M25/M40 family metallo-hydrolase [Ardenticatenaceae bacterium]|nr:M20/M25/M40 family metallo-hydrolase [Ardenticatenaceae bacterium]